VFPEKDLILAFYELRQELELSSGAFARGDWLWEMGKTNKDIKTFDDLHDMFYFFKTQKNIDTPMTIFATLDPGNEFVGYDTFLYCNGINTQYVKDGKVYLSNMGDNDRELMTIINKWFNEGLIDPNWASYKVATDYDAKIDAGEMGYMSCVRPSTMSGHAAAIPEGAPYGWVAMTKPVREEGQTLHLGYYVSRIYYGNASISASCENIPLACTWIDWRYSDEGSFIYGYGIQGLSWDYDENGEIYITDLILTNEVFWSMYMLFYALNSLADPGLYINYTWKVPGNEIGYTYLQDWEGVQHDNEMVWPAAIQFTQEQSETRAFYGSDIQTYLEENYIAFVDGSKPLSEWDSYVDGLHAIGVDEVLAAYQEAYDDFMAS
jgi:putative aldouronate transport system substrate-binding protein